MLLIRCFVRFKVRFLYFVRDILVVMVWIGMRFIDFSLGCLLVCFFKFIFL